MKVGVDTNVLVRLIVGDDDLQQKNATDLLEGAELVALSAHTFCELAWVLQRSYKVSKRDISNTIRRLLSLRNVVVNRPAIEAGLMVLDAGGDFADGVISFDGQWLGAETFVSFDRAAVEILQAKGTSARLLSTKA